MFRLERNSHPMQNVEVRGSLFVTHTLVYWPIQISFIDAQSRHARRRREARACRGIERVTRGDAAPDRGRRC